MITKRFGQDFTSGGGALTLNSNEVVDGDEQCGTFTKTHLDGWTITAELHEDWDVWINAFEANHPVYGRVWGDFEEEVYADTEEGFQDFYAKHPPYAWDYSDI